MNRIIRPSDHLDHVRWAFITGLLVAYTTNNPYHNRMFEECLYFNSNALARTVTRLWTEAYAPFGLSPPHAFILRVVLAQPGILPMDLAHEMSLSRSTVTRFLDSLEERGFLTRKPGKQDGRELHIHPTKKARDLHADLDKTGARLTQKIRQLAGRDTAISTVNQMRNINKLLSGA